MHLWTWKVTAEKPAEQSGETVTKTSDPASNPPPEAISAASAPEPPAEPEGPPPEPLTPERMAAENRRNDLFIIGGVLVVAFLFGSFKITDSDIWLHLKSGWQIDQEGVSATDP